MEAITDYIHRIDPDFIHLLKAGSLLLFCALVFGLIGRFIFGKRSVLNSSISSAIGIIFVLALTVVLRGYVPELSQYLPPLPFTHFSEENLIIFTFSGTDYTVICSQVLSMIILSFLVNIINGWLPTGKHMISWIFLRILTVLLAFTLHLVVVVLFNIYLPQGIVTYAPSVLLLLLILMMVTGALKFLVGALMATVNPLIAALYTFFFAHKIGKQISKSVLTTGILALVTLLLHKLGLEILSIDLEILPAYLPFMVLLTLMWYLVGHIL